MTAPEQRPDTGLLWRDAERTVFRGTRRQSDAAGPHILAVGVGGGGYPGTCVTTTSVTFQSLSSFGLFRRIVVVAGRPRATTIITTTTITAVA